MNRSDFLLLSLYYDGLDLLHSSGVWSVLSMMFYGCGYRGDLVTLLVIC